MPEMWRREATRKDREMPMAAHTAAEGSEEPTSAVRTPSPRPGAGRPMICWAVLATTTMVTAVTAKPAASRPLRLTSASHAVSAAMMP